MAKVFLKKNEDRRIRMGHYWVFSNEIGKIDGNPETGDIIELRDTSGERMGSGFYNKNSLITLRLLHKSYEGDFGAYAKKMIIQAYELRKALYPNRNSYRLVFSESDYLPGLIIDKYNVTYVLQVYCFGMQSNLKDVVKVLQEELGAKNIFTRNEKYFRKLEGLPETDEILLGEIGTETINDGKIKYRIEFADSQKTGFYFDQADNREFAERLVNEKTVLDAFCNSGGFGLHAAKAGASFVTFMDSTDSEIKNVRDNIKLNEIAAETEFVVSDIFVYLEKCIAANRKYDVVMIDPPAFAKSRKSIPTALKGYAKLNKFAIECVSPNGFLVTSSCSHHISSEDFLSSVNTAAFKAERQIQLVYFNSAALDHPKLPSMEETSYLKFAVFRVI